MIPRPASSAISLKMPDYAIYHGTKAAVEAVSPTFARELRGRQITVNAVASGPIATELFMTGKAKR